MGLKLLKPPRLTAGDTIGVVAPSHPVASRQKQYDKGIQNLRRCGFNVKEGKTVKLREALLPRGMYGEPEDATAETGKVIMQAAEDELVECVQQLEQGRLPILD